MTLEEDLHRMDELQHQLLKMGINIREKRKQNHDVNNVENKRIEKLSEYARLCRELKATQHYESYYERVEWMSTYIKNYH